MVLLDTGTSGTSREIYSEDADGKTRMRSQSQLRNDKYIMMQYTNWINSTPSLQKLLSCIAQWLEHSVCNPGIASSSLTIGILTVNFSTGTRSSCVQ